MKKAIMWLSILSASLLITMFACSAPTQKPSPQAEAPAPSAAPVAKSGWETTWDKWQAEARNERKLVIYGTAKPLVHQAIAKGIKQAHGIELEFLSGRSAEIEQKIMTEYRAGLHLPDVWMAGGPDTAVFIFKPADMAEDLDPLIIRPEARDPKTWYTGSFEKQYNDPWHLSFSFIAAVDIPLAVNNTLVRPDEIKSLDDLLDPKWKGKMILNDPTTSGKGQQSFVVIGWKMRDWDYWRAIAKQEPVLLRDTRLATDWLAKGRYPILISPSTSAAAEFMQAGAPIGFVRFAKEGYVSHSGGTISLLKKAPHPAAAKLFLNWLLSKEGQTTWSRADGTQSARTDVPTDHLDAVRLRDPNVKYFSTSDWEYVSRDLTKDVALAKEIFAPLIK